ncbi:Microspherule protein 1 [Sparganum proliferum]
MFKSRNKHRKAERHSTQDRRKPSSEYSNAPWRPEDDYLLINSVFVTCNLTEVHRCVRFSRPYTEADLEKRWRSLLFNQLVSSTALEAIAHLPPIIKSQLDRHIPFSSEEDSFLAEVRNADVIAKEGDDKYTVFENLLHDHPTTFYASRTAADLYAQWSRFRACRLVGDSSVPSADTSIADCQAKNGAHNVPAAPTGGACDVGGHADSFSDTEFLLEETVARDLQAGLPHLLENSATTRRRRMLSMPDYQGFQASVSQTVVDVLSSNSSSSHRRHHHHQQQNNSRQQHFGQRFQQRYRKQQPTHASTAIAERKSRSRSPSWTSPQPDSCTSPSPEDALDDRILQRQRERHRLRTRLQARMRRVAEEARRWTALVESKVAAGTIICDHQPVHPTLATLTGRRSRFLIKSKNVTFGRLSCSFSPDIDLTCEGEALRISRCHGQIYVSNKGTFWLRNFSKHPVFVDGNPVLKGREVELHDMSVVSLGHLSLRFDVEHEYLNWLSALGGDHSPPPAPLGNCSPSANLTDSPSHSRN